MYSVHRSLYVIKSCCKLNHKTAPSYIKNIRHLHANQIYICKEIYTHRIFAENDVHCSYFYFNNSSLFRNHKHFKNLIFGKHLFTSSFLCNTTGLPPKDVKETQKDNVEKVEDITESVFTIPNLLTVSRIVATPFLGYLVLHQSYTLACGVFVIAGITDVLDGYIARKFNQKSVFGSMLDPLADKLMVSVLTVTLTMADLLPAPLAVIIISRDVLLIAAGVYLRYISVPPPKTFSRFCDVTNATVKMNPSSISKINTFLQITLISASLAAPVFGFVDHWTLQTLWYLTGATTVTSGVGYIITRNKSVQFVQEKMKRKL